MADFTKCRSTENYHEGCAVTIQPVIANPSDKIIHVVHGTDNKTNWGDFFAIIAPRWDNIAYYYVEHP